MNENVSTKNKDTDCPSSKMLLRGFIIFLKDRDNLPYSANKEYKIRKKESCYIVFR